MPILNQKSGAPAGEGGTSTSTKKDAEKRLKEKRKAQKAELLAYLTPKTDLPPNIKAIVDDWNNPRAGGGSPFGEPLFNKIFGASPKVGDKVTLNEVFNKTFKGVDKMNELKKKWAEKGTATVEYVHNAKEPLQSEYVIRKLGK